MLSPRRTPPRSKGKRRPKTHLPSKLQILRAYGAYAFHNLLLWLADAPERGFSRRIPLTKKKAPGRRRTFQYSALVSAQKPGLLVFERTGGSLPGPRYSPPLDWKQLPK